MFGTFGVRRGWRWEVSVKSVISTLNGLHGSPQEELVWLQTKVPEQEHSSMFGVLFVFDHAA